MKLYILAAMAAAISTGAVAQQGQRPLPAAERDQRGSHNPAIKNSRVHAVPAPARGRSSFTERQARGRIAKAGFTNIRNLHKTRIGSWQAQAQRRNRTVTVTLDYKGNITAR